MLRVQRASVLVIGATPADGPERALRSAGHDVRAPGAGDSPLRALFDVRPELVVLDVDTGPGGWALLDRIRECCATPVLVLSSGEPELDLVRALRAGAGDFVAKPAGA